MFGKKNEHEIESACAGNSTVVVAGRGHVALEKAIELADGIEGSRAKFWAEDEKGKLIFIWGDPGPTIDLGAMPAAPGREPHRRVITIHKILGKPTPKIIAEMALSRFLEAESYPEEPDHDGSNSRGFRLETSHDIYIHFTIEPVWMEHHK